MESVNNNSASPSSASSKCCLNCGGFDHESTCSTTANAQCNKEYMGRLMIAQFQNKETEKKYKKVFKLMEEINELREKIKKVDRDIKKAPKHKEIQGYIKESIKSLQII